MPPPATGRREPGLRRIIREFPDSTPFYVASSLREYASGTREDEAMSTIASRLSEEQINALAAYIAGLAP